MESPSAICSSCNSVILDLLTWDLADRKRWEPVQTDYVSLMHSKVHLPGEVETLRNSADRCDVCRLITQEIEELSGGLEQLATVPDATSYLLFVTGLRRPKCELHVALGNCLQFSQTDSTSRRWRTLAFNCRPGFSDSLRNLPISLDGLRPYLPVVPYSYLDSEEALAQVKSWLDHCTSHHSQCARRSSNLPTRILDLSKLECERKVSLYFTRREPARYLTLSYSWGEDVRLKLESTADDTADPAARVFAQNLRMRRYTPINTPDAEQTREETCTPDNIPFRLFPATLRDAVLIARYLGIQYIWIDALCIVQNVEKDWANESAVMSRIYENSELTISASSSKGSNAGIFQDMDDKSIPLINATRAGQDAHVSVERKPQLLGIDDLHISTRGWTFQERLVSTATIHFTKHGLIWECGQRQVCSHRQQISCEPMKRDWEVLRRAEANDHARFYKFWTEWVNLYSGRTLLKKQDKMPAVAGIAKVLADRLSLTDSYAAGLWKENLLFGLLWRRWGRTQTLVSLPHVAPSWSWASVDGRLEGPNGRWKLGTSKGRDLVVTTIKVEERHAYGRLEFDAQTAQQPPGYRPHLEARGLLQQVIVDRQKRPGPRPQPWREVGVVSGFKNHENVECMLDQWSSQDETVLHCWCLRVGSEMMEGDKVTDHFLLLEEVDGTRNHYVRIGTARCDENFDKGRTIPDSGLLSSPVDAELKIF